jgi:hypothetical protein
MTDSQPHGTPPGPARGRGSMRSCTGLLKKGVAIRSLIDTLFRKMLVYSY